MKHAGLYQFFFSLTHRASDRQDLAAEWVNLPTLPIVISDRTQNSYQPTGPVLLKSYEPKAKVTCLWSAGGY